MLRPRPIDNILEVDVLKSLVFTIGVSLTAQVLASDYDDEVVDYDDYEQEYDQEFDEEIGVGHSCSCRMTCKLNGRPVGTLRGYGSDRVYSEAKRKCRRDAARVSCLTYCGQSEGCRPGRFSYSC